MSRIEPAPEYRPPQPTPCERHGLIGCKMCSDYYWQEAETQLATANLMIAALREALIAAKRWVPIADSGDVERNEYLQAVRKQIRAALAIEGSNIDALLADSSPAVAEIRGCLS